MPRKVLIVVENELLAQLYKTNLMVYLESEVVWVRTYEALFKALDANQDIQLVICQTVLETINMTPEFNEFYKSKKLSCPVILFGELDDRVDNITYISETFNIQHLLSTSARLLGVTAQMMASFQVPEFYPVDIEFIYYLKKAPTSLYVELNNEYILFANKDASIAEVARDLKSEGVTKFYVKSIERLEIVGKITDILKESLMDNTKLTTFQKTEIISNGFDYFVNNFISPEASQEIVHMANVCSRVMNEVAQEAPDLQSLFVMFRNNKNNYCYIHTMLGVYVSTHIVRNVPWGGESQIDKLNYVFFFHDILLAPIYIKYPHLKGEEDLIKCEELTRQEKHTVMNHARLSAEMIMTLKKSPIGSDQLVKQHHGMNSGIGFAEEFKDDISPLAKIVIVSEAFIEIFIKSKEEHPERPIDIVETIQILNERFKKNSYKKIVETLLTLRI